MGEFSSLVQAGEVAVAGPKAAGTARSIAKATGLIVYENSPAVGRGALALLARTGVDKVLVVAAPEDDQPNWVWGFSGRRMRAEIAGTDVVIRLCPLTRENAAALRRDLPYTAPGCFGTDTAFGAGDRLGIATPGHVRAVAGTGVVPFFAQQSIREMTRTGRDARRVMDDACWGVFQEGWTAGFGSDADHLKNTADIDTCIAAGFTMYTIDPGDHVDNAADTAPLDEVAGKFRDLDWGALETTAEGLRREYRDAEVRLPHDVTIKVTEEVLLRAAVKYGRAVAHTTGMFRHLATRMGDRPFELEMSVDETETPTSIFEHYFVVRELNRLGVKWVSLAPRFVGDFEKGIDYKGDKKKFEQSFAGHVAVMREFGPYKMSIHSGSDKFSIYPIVAQQADGLVHLKTAGTSYLEALGVIAKVASDLFREILAFAFERYETDKRSYHVSADIAKVPRPDQLKDRALLSVLDEDDGRQLLHVTFGSVLTAKSEDGRPRFRDRLLMALRSDEEDYYAALEKHIGRHVAPFAGA
ncbi:MAG: tagaturonate epimerase family protein [Planctomycetota bacterium]